MKYFLLFIFIGTFFCFTEPTLASPTVTNTFQTSSDQSTVTQTITVDSTNVINKTFGFCNGQTCGSFTGDPTHDTSVECRVNRWVPSWDDSGLLDRISVPGPAGSTLKSMYMKTYGTNYNTETGQTGIMPAAANFGQYVPGKEENDWNSAILSDKPVIEDTSKGFEQSQNILLYFRKPDFLQFNGLTRAKDGGWCGITQDQIDAFKSQYGFGNDSSNFYNARYKIVIEWSKPTDTLATPPAPTINNTPSTAGQAVPSNQTLSFPRYSQLDSGYKAVAFGGGSFANTGNVPTTTANALSALGKTTNPTDVAKGLQQAGAISMESSSFFVPYLTQTVFAANPGVDLVKYVTYLDSQGITATNTPLTTFLMDDASFTNRIVPILNYTRKTTHESSQVIITSFDPNKGLGVLNSFGKNEIISVDDLLGEGGLWPMNLTLKQ